MKAAALLGFMIMAATSSQAGEYCWNESIQLLIMQGDDIYFTTDKTCPNWCTLHPEWSQEARKRAYATLLTAKTTGTPVTFFWHQHSTACESPLPVHSYPGSIILNN